MKKLNFLSKLCSPLLGSRSSDVSHDCRLTVGSLSGLPTKSLLKLVSILVLIFTLGVGNAWGASPETFQTKSGQFSSGSKTIAPITVKIEANGGTSPSWQSDHVRFYASNKVTISCTSGYSITNITINAKSGYANATLDGFSANDAHTTYTWSGTSTSIVSTNTGSAQARITSIVVTYTTAGASLTATPSSLDFGSVAQNASVEAQTFSISGSNLSNGTLTISAPSGYTVSPTSIAVNGTLSATTITVTPVTTSTGTFNGNVTISGGGLASNVTVALTMSVQSSYAVTWKNNGSTHATTYVISGQKPTFPSNPTSCDAGEGASTTFYGWSTSSWSGKIDDISAKTIYTSAGDMPTVTGNGVVYHAVFCKGGDQGSITISSSDLKTGLSGSYGSGSFSESYGGNSYTFNTYACVQSSTFQMRNSDSYIQIPTLPGAITNISSSECHNAGTGDYSGTLRLKSAFAAGNTNTNDIASKDVSGTSFSWDISASATSGYITTSAGFRLVNLTIYFGTAGSKYMTSCCTELGTINGSFF